MNYKKEAAVEVENYLNWFREYAPDLSQTFTQHTEVGNSKVLKKNQWDRGELIGTAVEKPDIALSLSNGSGFNLALLHCLSAKDGYIPPLERCLELTKRGVWTPWVYSHLITKYEGRSTQIQKFNPSNHPLIQSIVNKYECNRMKQK